MGIAFVNNLLPMLMITLCNILNLSKSALTAKNLEMRIVLSNFTLYLASPGNLLMVTMCHCCAKKIQPFSCSELTQEFIRQLAGSSVIDNWLGQLFLIVLQV